MIIDLAGTWQLTFPERNDLKKKEIVLPGILQAQNTGDAPGFDTNWQSSLHDPFWYEREEYQYEQNARCRIPFLSPMPRLCRGKAVYSRHFCIDEEDSRSYVLFLELTKWTTKVFLDGEEKGSYRSGCVPHIIKLGQIGPGEHELSLEIDNRCPAPYRPDGHMVSDALGANWHGIGGRIELISYERMQAIQDEKKAYADKHPAEIKVKNGNFILNGRPVFIRAAHFGGDFPLTGYPSTDPSIWRKIFRRIKEWGMNAMRFHSFCPPEAAFKAADEEGIMLLVECGMWNYFAPGIEMLEILRRESRRILRAFGHHPSFLFFSSGNEPEGPWYDVLRTWVRESKAYDEAIGYKGRRLYTAQSGWFYDTPPAETRGTDFLYFHRSGFGPIPGGSIRNEAGWKGRDYRVSLEDCDLPVMGHELGQWCRYPDFSVIEKYAEKKALMRPDNFELFKARAEEAGLLSLNQAMSEASARQQLRLYKEDIEANLRTPQIKGFELLDLRDYTGQGTALVGFLDPFWENKGYVKAEEFRRFCQDTVITTRLPSYVFTQGDEIEVPLEIAHYGAEPILDAELIWAVKKDGITIRSAFVPAPPVIRCGRNTVLPQLYLNTKDYEPGAYELSLRLGESENTFPLYICEKEAAEDAVSSTDILKRPDLVVSQDIVETEEALREGRRVLYFPRFSDLSYDSPGSSYKNIYWNSQMGPSWVRSLGLLIADDSAAFSRFPTAKDGGVQWERLLKNSRAVNMRSLPQAEFLIRQIDDWNRSFSLALLWQAKACEGRLLVSGIDLYEVIKKQSPALPEERAFARSLLDYLASEAFAPQASIDFSAFKKCLFPITRMEALQPKLSCPGARKIKGGDGLFSWDPHQASRIEAERFPIKLRIDFPETQRFKGLLFLPEQRDRMRGGAIKEAVLRFFDEESREEKRFAFHLKNKIGEQRMEIPDLCRTQSLELEILSAYGQPPACSWQLNGEGWVFAENRSYALFQAAALHLMTGSDAEETRQYTGIENKGANLTRSKTKEIEA